MIKLVVETADGARFGLECGEERPMDDPSAASFAVLDDVFERREKVLEMMATLNSDAEEDDDDEL